MLSDMMQKEQPIELLDMDKQFIMTGSRRRYLVTGNWNANGDTTFIKSFTMNVLSKLRTDNKDGDVIVAPPFLYMQMLQEELLDYEINSVKVCG